MSQLGDASAGQIYIGNLSPVSRRNWRIIFAVIVLGLLGSLGTVGYNLYQASKQQQTDYRYQPANKPGFRIGRVSKSPTEEYKPNCQNPYEREDADLCAQWAAVDQASEANRLVSLNTRLALLSLFFTVAGTGLLVWTLDETRQTSRRELRAYVSVEMAGLEFTLVDGQAAADIILKNGGQTPAYGCCHNGNIIVRTDEEAEHDIMRRPRQALGRANPFTLHMGDPQRGSLFAHDMITLADLKEVVEGDKWLYIFGTVFYQDTFGIDRETRFCVKTDEIEIPSDDPRKWPRHRPAPRPCTWLMADFHNEST